MRYTVVFYMDGIIFTSNDLKMFVISKDKTKKFGMTYIGYMSYFFGVEVSESNKSILIS